MFIRKETNMFGKKTWLIPDGYLSDTVTDDYVSHEAVCVLNLSGETAHINLTLYFEDAEPMRGFHVECQHERTNHIRMDRMLSDDGKPVPRNLPYAILVESDQPIVVQYSRLDVSQPEFALMTTIPY